jgi:hypothetical protein
LTEPFTYVADNKYGEGTIYIKGVTVIIGVERGISGIKILSQGVHWFDGRFHHGQETLIGV